MAAKILCIFVRMRTIHVITALLLLFFSACALLRPYDELASDAEAALEAGDKVQALTHYDALIAAYEEDDERAPGEVYQQAGLLAFALDDTSKSIDYLEQARHTRAANAETYEKLAKAYREIDNLSREITMLEHYVDNYAGADAYQAMQYRLFETLEESRNYEQAYALWEELDGEPREDEKMMTVYLRVLQALEKGKEATGTAEDLLKLNDDNMEALDWLAKKHFRQAESLYNREMQAYEENRTHRQYAQLLDALEIVNTDLRIALDYFKRLYEQEPSSEYASYLANIYARFQDEEKARYYQKRAQ